MGNALRTQGISAGNACLLNGQSGVVGRGFCPRCRNTRGHGEAVPTLLDFGRNEREGSAHPRQHPLHATHHFPHAALAEHFHHLLRLLKLI